MSAGYVDLTIIWSREKLSMDWRQGWEDLTACAVSESNQLGLASFTM